MTKYEAFTTPPMPDQEFNHRPPLSHIRVKDLRKALLDKNWTPNNDGFIGLYLDSFIKQASIGGVWFFSYSTDYNPGTDTLLRYKWEGNNKTVVAAYLFSK